MTQNQLQFHANREIARANLAKEELQSREIDVKKQQADAATSQAESAARRAAVEERAEQREQELQGYRKAESVMSSIASGAKSVGSIVSTFTGTGGLANLGGKKNSTPQFILNTGGRRR